MRDIEHLEAMRAWSQATRRAGERIVFVPTMGALHAGHIALIQRARGLGDHVVVSLFVNPTQFGPGEDFDRYPRMLEADREACRAHAVDVFFRPSAEAMYPPGHSVYVQEDRLSQPLCGARRPGHFRGVLTVVAQLFNLVQPHTAVFGQKDAQQARLIQQMARDLHMGVEVRMAPTVREADGLAMSSRNRYLSAVQRAQAPALARALAHARAVYEAGRRDAAEICSEIRAQCARWAPEAALEYVEAMDFDRMEPVDQCAPGTLLAIGARLGATRLIDNILLDAGTVADRFGLLPEDG